jgi:dGTPase
VTIAQLLEVPLWHEARDRVARRFVNLDEDRLRRAIVHEMIEWQVSDVLAVAGQELSARSVRSVADVRQAGQIVRPSAELAEKKAGLERFLFDQVYRHSAVLAKRREAQLALRETFDALVSQPELLPLKFARLAERDGLHRAVADYLAGMTDRFAIEEHQRLAGGL